MSNSASTIAPVIFGCHGTQLSAQEIAFFEQVNPFGFILFGRNIEAPEQVKALTQQMRDVVGRADVPIFIDQEGGRVQRMSLPHWPAYPPAASFAERYQQAPDMACEACHVNASKLAADLRAVGINVNCAPLLDILTQHTHEVIGDRAFGEQVEQVIALGRAMMEGMAEQGVLSVIKHIPGHGRGAVDSHHDLPVVDAPLSVIAEEAKPFHALRDAPFAMTAHILYTALDDALPATLSPKVIRFIREGLGFEGLLMGDDISMKALSGDIGELAIQSLNAGCDLVLHCNGDMAEMQAIAEILPKMQAARYDLYCQQKAAIGLIAK